MKIKIINIRYHVQKRLAKLIMKTFIFLLCTTALGFTHGIGFSQEKITIDLDKEVTIHEIFKIIKNQTEYRFIYPEDLFEKTANVKLKKGVINLNELLIQARQIVKKWKILMFLSYIAEIITFIVMIIILIMVIFV